MGEPEIIQEQDDTMQNKNLLIINSVAEGPKNVTVSAPIIKNKHEQVRISDAPTAILDDNFIQKSHNNSTDKIKPNHSPLLKKEDTLVNKVH